MTIYQKHLDKLSQAILSNDFGSFVTGIQFPFTMTTQVETHVFNTHADARKAFDSLGNNLRAQSVTVFARIAQRAAFVDPTHIVGEHEAHILKDGNRLVKPYPSRVHLQRFADGWRETHCENAIVSSPHLFSILTEASRDDAPPVIPDPDLGRIDTND